MRICRLLHPWPLAVGLLMMTSCRGETPSPTEATQEANATGALFPWASRSWHDFAWVSLPLEHVQVRSWSPRRPRLPAGAPSFCEAGESSSPAGELAPGSSSPESEEEVCFFRDRPLGWVLMLGLDHTMALVSESAYAAQEAADTRAHDTWVAPPVAALAFAGSLPWGETTADPYAVYMLPEDLGQGAAILAYLQTFKTPLYYVMHVMVPSSNDPRSVGRAHRDETNQGEGYVSDVLLLGRAPTCDADSGSAWPLHTVNEVELPDSAVDPDAHLVPTRVRVRLWNIGPVPVRVDATRGSPMLFVRNRQVVGTATPPSLGHVVIEPNTRVEGTIEEDAGQIQTRVRSLAAHTSRWVSTVWNFESRLPGSPLYSTFFVRVLRPGQAPPPSLPGAR